MTMAGFMIEVLPSHRASYNNATRPPLLHCRLSADQVVTQPLYSCYCQYTMPGYQYKKMGHTGVWKSKYWFTELLSTPTAVSNSTSPQIQRPRTHSSDSITDLHAEIYRC